MSPPLDLTETAAHLRLTDGHLLVGEPVVGRLVRKRWSPSSAKGLQGCPARWASERLLRGPDMPFDPAPLGTAAHRVLEVFYELPVAQRTRDAMATIVSTLDTAHAQHVAAPSDPAALLTWRSEVLKRCLPIFDIEDPSTVQVVGLERSLKTASIDGVPFVGFIDRTRVILGEDGSPCGTGVDDYKSSAGGAKTDWKRRTYGDDHGDQLRLYALALENLDGRMPDSVRALYTMTGEVYEAALDARSLTRVRREFVTTWKRHQELASSGAYPTVAGPLCPWCPLATICPAAAEVGKSTARVEGARAGELLGVKVDSSTPRTVSSTAPPVADNPKKENAMSTTATRPIVIEDKSWVETSPDNTLNGNSYAAMAAFGLTTTAVEYLDKHGQKVSAATVSSLAATFHLIVTDIQLELSGREGLMDGLNTRLRGSLHTALGTLAPAPFGQDEAAWEAWVNRVKQRVRAQAQAAINLWAHGHGTSPWQALAVPLAQTA